MMRPVAFFNFALSGLLALSQQSAAQSLPAEKPPAENKPRTAILLLKGPEQIPEWEAACSGNKKAAIDSTPEWKTYYKRLEKEKAEVVQFNTVFADYPHLVLGGPESDIALTDIPKALRQLDSLAPGAETLFLLVDQHGNDEIQNLELQNDKKYSGIETHVNALHRTNAAKDLFPMNSKNLFRCFSLELADPRYAHFTEVVIAHSPCSGVSGMPSTAELNAPATVIFTSARDSSSWDCDSAVYARFGRDTYQKEGGYRLDRKHIIGEFLYAYNDGDTSQYNDLYVAVVQNRAPDTAKIGRQRLVLGRFGVNVTDCSALAPQIMQYDDMLLFNKLPDLAKTDRTLQDIAELKTVLLHHPGKNALRKLTPQQRGLANVLTWQFTQADPGITKNLAAFLQSNQAVKGIEKPNFTIIGHRLVRRDEEDDQNSLRLKMPFAPVHFLTGQGAKLFPQHVDAALNRPGRFIQ